MKNTSLSVCDFCNQKELPSHDTLFNLLDKAILILEEEKGDLRPQNDEGEPGGLILLTDTKPAIIVPDIHARPAFVKNIVNFKLPQKFIKDYTRGTVLQLLNDNNLYMVCVGDAFHTERTRNRWLKIQSEFDQNNYTGPNMCAEMTECLNAFCALLLLKIQNPLNFHFIKGNHENIMNVNCDGNSAFFKYADEGNMVKNFISAWYGDDILYLISLYENLLPLVVKLPKAVVSHAEPSLALTKDQIINIKSNPVFVHSLIWTANDEVKDNTVEKIIENLFERDSQEAKKDVVYFAGHRPVKSSFALRQKGRLIQLHNPGEQNIAVVESENGFNPEKNILNVDNHKKEKQE